MISQRSKFFSSILLISMLIMLLFNTYLILSNNTTENANIYFKYAHGYIASTLNLIIFISKPLLRELIKNIKTNGIKQTLCAIFPMKSKSKVHVISNITNQSDSFPQFHCIYSRPYLSLKTKSNTEKKNNFVY